MRRREGLSGLAAIVVLAAWPAARAQAGGDAVALLRAFVRDVAGGRARFTQVVTSADGARRRTSSGEFEFLRPNRFRFVYTRPFEQTIVADGAKVWIHDPDLNQASSRRIEQALGATPAALLAGGALDADFDLRDDRGEGGSDDGLQWARATPKASGGQFQYMRVGFRGRELAAIEIADSFGQRSRLDFSGFVADGAIPAERFRFVPPPGTDVIEQ